MDESLDRPGPVTAGGSDAQSGGDATSIVANTGSLSQFSIYNNQLDRPYRKNSPLSFLEPVTNEYGWHVARNLRKPLNHIEHLKRKEAIALALNLHSVITPSAIFDKNYGMLERHQSGDLSTSSLVDHIATQLSASGPPVSVNAVRSLLKEYATVGHMEFHPTDFCNLTCIGCTYGHDDELTKPPPVSFPFESINKIASFQPRSMVIVGGGEPTLYRWGQHGFQDVVAALTASNPSISLGLSTNGTHKPEGKWPDRFDWIRVSLDAATEATYANFRGKHQFERVMRHFLEYLEHETPYIGISFVFAKSNVHEYAAVAKLVYDRVMRRNPAALPRVNVQYRPLRLDPHNCDKPFKEALGSADIAQTVDDIVSLARSSSDMERFLREQTNITAILGGNSHLPHEFSRCYYSQSFRIVRATGELRPCFIRVVESDFVLGNVISDSMETIALNTLYIGARRKPHCDPYGCRQCHINYTLEKGLSGEMSPSSSANVLADSMF